MTFGSADGTSSPAGGEFSTIGVGFLGDSMIFGLAAGVSSEYGGPAILSSMASLDSVLLDSPALALGFVTGAGCLARFACKVFAFFAGTAGFDSEALASFDGLQQFRAEKNLESPFFLGFSVFSDEPRSIPFWSLDVTGAAVLSSFESFLLPALPLRLDTLMLPFDARFQIFSSSMGGCPPDAPSGSVGDLGCRVVPAPGLDS